MVVDLYQTLSKLSHKSLLTIEDKKYWFNKFSGKDKYSLTPAFDDLNGKRLRIWSDSNRTRFISLMRKWIENGKQ